MIKNPTAKYWKQTHHSGKNSRKNSIEDLNDSAMSNHSSLSTGYNRFKFQPRDKQQNKRQNIFQYTARNKEKPMDISAHSKKSEAIGSRKSLDLVIPQRDSLVRLDSYREDNTTQRIKSKPVRDLAKELKFLTTSLKRTIQYFAKQLKELKIEWDSSIKQLLKYQISCENTAIVQLRQCLQQKQKEIEKFKQDFENIDKKIVYKESAFKMRHAQSHTEGASLPNLTISKIEVAISNEAEEKLSRNNTLNSLLGQKQSNPAQVTLGYCRDNQELIVIKQAVRRMREVLDTSG